MGFPIVASNAQLQSQATDFVNAYNSRALPLMLWTNDYHPTPATALGDLAEASYAGYARRNCGGTLGPAVKIEDGLYQTTLALQSFPAPVSGSQMIYGWALLDSSGTIVIFSKRLDTPLNFASGGGALNIQVNLDWASWGIVTGPP